MPAPIIQSPKFIDFICRHWNKDIPGVRLARLWRINYSTLSTRVDRLRSKGYDIAKNAVPIGTVTTRNFSRSGPEQRIKTAEGWQRVPKVRQVKEKPPNRAKQPTQKPAPQPKQIKPKTQPMPPRNTTRKIAADKPKPIKRTGLTFEEKKALGWRLVLVCERPKAYAQRPPDKLTA